MMTGTLAVFAAVTCVGTAILTCAAVAKLILEPVTSAIRRLESNVQRVEQKVDAIEARHQSDIKDLWKFIAQGRD